MRKDIQENLDKLYDDVKKRSDGPSSKDVIHVEERFDGSSDGLPEDLKIHQYNDDGSYEYSECLWWNKDLQQEWTLKQLSPKNKELTAEQLIDTFSMIDEMRISEKREKILNKLTQGDLKKLHKIYETYKTDKEKKK